MKTRFAFIALMLMVASSAFAQFPAPVEQHQALAPLAGNWKGTLSLQMPGMAEPMTSEVTFVCEMSFGGFWLVSRIEGNMMGNAFAARSTLGYDPEKGKYIESWVDSFRPSMGVLEGDYDAASRKWIKWLANSKHPMTGVSITERHTQQLVDDDTMLIEIAFPGESEGEYIVYMRTELSRAE